MPPIPNITGYPVLDTFLRNFIGYATMATAAAMVAWLNSKGFSGAAVSAYLPYIVVTALIALATFIWSLIAKYKMIFAFVEHTLEAAQSGQVQSEVAAVASPDQAFAIKTLNAHNAADVINKT